MYKRDKVKREEHCIIYLFLYIYKLKYYNSIKDILHFIWDNIFQ